MITSLIINRISKFEYKKATIEFEELQITLKPPNK